MKIELRITDNDGNVTEQSLIYVKLTDEEIEQYAASGYGEDGELWKRITNSFIVGAKWARDVLYSRVKQ